MILRQSQKQIVSIPTGSIKISSTGTFTVEGEVFQFQLVRLKFCHQKALYAIESATKL